MVYILRKILNTIYFGEKENKSADLVVHKGYGQVKSNSKKTMFHLPQTHTHEKISPFLNEEVGNKKSRPPSMNSGGKYDDKIRRELKMGSQEDTN